MYTDIIYIALNYKRILFIKIAYTNYLASSLNIYINRTLLENPKKSIKKYKDILKYKRSNKSL